VKRSVSIVVLGLGGLVAAVALTLGALALAGEDVGQVVQPALTGEGDRTATATASHRGDDHGGERSDSPSATPSADDHGGDSGHDGPGSGDASGHGSGSGDSSGSGSSGSGSGDSSESGSGDD
jgi:hypothetical protein